MSNKHIKDCFDCTQEDCPYTGINSYDNNGLPLDYCLMDPIIDRYEKIKKSKLPKPCNTCQHGTKRNRDRCLRCTHFKPL